MIIDEKISEKRRTTFIKEYEFQVNYVIELYSENKDFHVLKVMNTERWYNPVELFKEEIHSEEDALEKYKKLVNDYIDLQKSKEIIKVKPEDIFKTEINYRKQNTCKNCAWNLDNSRGGHHCDKHKIPFIHPVLCTNPYNLRFQNNIEEDYNRIMDADRHNKELMDVNPEDDMGLFYHDAYIKRSHGTFPEVDPDGICENYQKYNSKEEN